MAGLLEYVAQLGYSISIISVNSTSMAGINFSLKVARVYSNPERPTIRIVK